MTDIDDVQDVQDVSAPPTSPTSRKAKSKRSKKKTRDRSRAWVGGIHQRTASIIVLVSVILIVVLAITLFIWALVRAGFSTSSPAGQPIADPSGTLLGERKTFKTTTGDLLAEINMIGSELVDTSNPGIHFLRTGEGIRSEDAKYALILDSVGDLILLNTKNEPATVVWKSGTGNRDGIKFVIVQNGNGYILRANGSRVTSTVTAPDGTTREVPWITPNQRRAYFRVCSVASPSDNYLIGATYRAFSPYKLRFYDSGLVLVSDNAANQTANTKYPIPVVSNLWWISENNVLPPGELDTTFPESVGVCTTGAGSGASSETRQTRRILHKV